jgi:predicted GTPase
MNGGGRRYPRWAMLMVALLLPAASLLPFGSLWLWQHGVILYWAIATCVMVVAVYYFEQKLIDPVAAPAAPDQIDPAPPEAGWSPRQAAAWEDVARLANQVSPERMTSREAVLGLGLETIEVVAKRLHPERRDPLLQFTLPEALAVIERASLNLRRFLVSSFPLGDRITVAQFMWLYRWRGALELAEKGYDLWRVVRLLNPVAAVTQELRERFTRQIYDMGREHLARRIARAFVREVGRAAIDLYGGNLRIAPERVSAHISASSRQDLAAAEARAAEPVRILVAGQIGAGKSSLINALANAVEAVVDTLPSTTSFTAARLVHEGLPAALAIDSPGLADLASLPALIDAANDCDMLLWVTSATRAAREIDATALDRIREHFRAQPNRHRPPMLLVLTHIDRLRPFAEWDPPYDLAAATRAKAQSIRGALEAAAAELGFAVSEVVPVRTDIAVAPYNIDALWVKILELMPEAQRARLLRMLKDLQSTSNWGAIWSQAVNAGRVIGETLFTRSENHVADAQAGGHEGGRPAGKGQEG